MSKRNIFLASAFSVILLLTCAPRWHAQQVADKQDAQAISQTGLLPVYGVDFAFDTAWVDGERFLGQSADVPNFGVNAAFQKVWDALKPSGFNAIRFPVDARDAQNAKTDAESKTDQAYRANWRCQAKRNANANAAPCQAHNPRTLETISKLQAPRIVLRKEKI
jgi:hypothetical protein